MVVHLRGCFLIMYALITLKKSDDEVKLLVPVAIDLSIVTVAIADIFALNHLMRTALKDFMSDYSSQIKSLSDKLIQLRNAGVIGYPLDARDALLYALDNNIDIESELEINCDEKKHGNTGNKNSVKEVKKEAFIKIRFEPEPEQTPEQEKAAAVEKLNANMEKAAAV